MLPIIDTRKKLRVLFSDGNKLCLKNMTKDIIKTAMIGAIMLIKKSLYLKFIIFFASLVIKIKTKILGITIAKDDPKIPHLMVSG